MPTEPAPAVATRHCEWFTGTTGDTFGKCGEPITDGLELCPRHRGLRAHILLSGPRPVARNEFFHPDEPAAPRPAPPAMDWGAVIDAAAPVAGRPVPLGSVPPSDIYLVAGIGMPGGTRQTRFPKADLSFLPLAM